MKAIGESPFGRPQAVLSAGIANMAEDIAKDTLRTLVSVQVGLEHEAASSFMKEWTADSSLAKDEFLTWVLRRCGHTSHADIDHAAQAIAQRVKGVPVCDFVDRLPAVGEQFREREVGLVDKLRALHCPIIHACLVEEMTAIIIGTLNPIAGLRVANWMLQHRTRFDATPYVGVMQLSSEAWTKLSSR